MLSAGLLSSAAALLEKYWRRQRRTCSPCILCTCASVPLASRLHPSSAGNAPRKQYCFTNLGDLHLLMLRARAAVCCGSRFPHARHCQWRLSLSHTLCLHSCLMGSSCFSELSIWWKPAGAGRPAGVGGGAADRARLPHQPVRIPPSHPHQRQPQCCPACRSRQQC